MLDLSSLAKTETPEDIIKILTREKPTSIRSIDFFFNRHRERVVDHSKLLLVVHQLIKENVLAFTETELIIRGPTWTEPDFMKQGKYGIAAARTKNSEQE